MDFWDFFRLAPLGLGARLHFYLSIGLAIGVGVVGARLGYGDVAPWAAVGGFACYVGAAVAYACTRR